LIATDISWVNDFAVSIRDYVYVRERDSLLILLPNQAYKLNPSALYLLKSAIDGVSINDALESRKPGWSDDPQVREDVHRFFCDVRALVMGCLGEGQERSAVETVQFERPHNSLPVLSEIALTYRCNLACRFCYVGCGCTKRPKTREMTTEQAKRVLDVIRNDAEVPSVSWTGGEPTLRDDLVELTAYAKSIGMRVNLITNGTLVDRDLVMRLRDAGLSSAQVSVEGPDANVHDALTQVPGSFDRTIRAVEALRDAELHVHTNTTVNALNAPHVAEMVELTKTFGLSRFSMNMAIPCGSAPISGVTITYTQMADLVESVRKRARADGIKFMWYSPTPYCIYNPVAAGLGGKACAACDGLLSVTPTGDVIPCSSLAEPVGNLLRSSFEKVWNSRRSVYWRQKRYAHKLCKGCETFDICTGACPIYWRDKGYAELNAARAGRHRGTAPAPPPGPLRNGGGRCSAGIAASTDGRNDVRIEQSRRDLMGCDFKSHPINKDGRDEK